MSDGKTLTVGSTGAMLWDIETGNEKLLLAKNIEDVRTIAFSVDGKWLATGAPRGAARLWNVQTGRDIESNKKVLDGPKRRRATKPRFAFGTRPTTPAAI